MKHKHRKLFSAIALTVSLLMLLTACDMEGIPLIGDIFAPAQEQEVETIPVPETTAPVATTAPAPVETEPVETEPQVIYYWVRADGGLNVRRGPGQEYEIVGRLDDGIQVCPQDWQNGWAYIEYPFAGWCSGDYLFDVSQVQIANNAILGTWCSGRGHYTEDGLFSMHFGNYWTFRADGTFVCTETESLWYYNPNGTVNNVLGAGALDAKGTFSFDGVYLTVVTTHRFESSSGPYVKLYSPTVSTAKITFDGDTLLVDWGSWTERFYRETGDDLVRRLMREQQ